MCVVYVEGPTQQHVAQDVDDQPLQAGLLFGVSGRPPEDNREAVQIDQRAAGHMSTLL